MDILLNPITISVVVMCICCLYKVNVLISLIIASVLAGVLGGMDLNEVFKVLVDGMNGNAETALSYILLGTYAATLAHIGVSDAFARKISVLVKGSKLRLILIVTLCAVVAETLIPVHIAFIPILIPPLLVVMNKMKIDRRSVASALAFGLKAPYISLPIGFGLIFHGIIADNMTLNGMAVTREDVWKSTWILGVAMIVGLLLSLIYFSKNREYKDIDILKHDEKGVNNTDNNHSKYVVAVISIFTTLIVQLYMSSMPIGVMAGLLVLVLGRTIKLNDLDKLTTDGIALMGMIAFIMLIASGYGSVIKSIGAVDTLVSSAIAILGDNQLVSAIVMIGIGLIITMGIGTSFGTVPIIAVLYVPMAQNLGFSTQATIILIATAAALGDAGSPASDTTLGPTSGLNIDGQHNHIKDTCIPTFLFYNIPLMIFGVLGALYL